MESQITKSSKKVEGISNLAQNCLKNIRDMFEPCPIQFSSGMHINEQTKYLSYNLRPLKDEIELLHMTDMQFGHVACNVKKVIEYRDWVLSQPNRFVLFGGDCIDSGTKLSVGSPWEQLMEPQGQVYRFCELFAPMRHRILGYAGGL